MFFVYSINTLGENAESTVLRRKAAVPKVRLCSKKRCSIYRSIIESDKSQNLCSKFAVFIFRPLKYFGNTHFTECILIRIHVANFN